MIPNQSASTDLDNESEPVCCRANSRQSDLIRSLGWLDKYEDDLPLVRVTDLLPRLDSLRASLGSGKSGTVAPGRRSKGTGSVSQSVNCLFSQF